MIKKTFHTLLMPLLLPLVGVMPVSVCAQGAKIEQSGQIRDRNMRLSAGGVLYNDGWAASLQMLRQDKRRGLELRIQEYIHPKEQKQINKEYLTLFDKEKVTPFYYKKQHNVYTLALSYVQEYVMYSGGNFSVFNRNTAGVHLNLSKPVYYRVIYAYPDSAGRYDVRTEPIRDDNLDRTGSAKSILGKEPVYRNLNKMTLSAGISGTAALGMEIAVSSYLSTQLLAGGLVGVNSSRLVSLRDYPKQFLYASGWVGGTIVLKF